MHLPALRNRQELLAFLLQTTTLTTPVLQSYLRAKLTVTHQVVADVRHYRLCLPDGTCVEAGIVRALTPEGIPLLHAKEPLGPWALNNGYSCEKKEPATLRISDPGHPIAQALGAPCKHIIGRGYLFLLKKQDSLIPLQIEEYWNTALF